MRALFGSLTTRGRSFMAAGGAAIVCGLAIPEPDLVRVGALLVILPAVSALLSMRSILGTSVDLVIAIISYRCRTVGGPSLNHSCNAGTPRNVLEFTFPGSAIQ